MLARPAEEYTTDAILQAVEGTLAPVACLDDVPNQCEHRNEYKTLPLWLGLEQTILKYLNGITLADIIEGKKLV